MEVDALEAGAGGGAGGAGADAEGGADADAAGAAPGFGFFGAAMADVESAARAKRLQHAAISSRLMTQRLNQPPNVPKAPKVTCDGGFCAFTPLSDSLTKICAASSGPIPA